MSPQPGRSKGQRVQRGRPQKPRRDDRDRQGRGERKSSWDQRDPHKTSGRTPGRPLVHLPDDVVAELKGTARPGKGQILVQVFAEAATAFEDENLAEAIKLAEQAKHIALRSATVRGASGPCLLPGRAVQGSGARAVGVPSFGGIDRAESGSRRLLQGDGQTRASSRAM